MEEGEGYGEEGDGDLHGGEGTWRRSGEPWLGLIKSRSKAAPNWDPCTPDSVWFISRLSLRRTQQTNSSPVAVPLHWNPFHLLCGASIVCLRSNALSIAIRWANFIQSCQVMELMSSVRGQAVPSLRLGTFRLLIQLRQLSDEQRLLESQKTEAYQGENVEWFGLGHARITPGIS